MKIINLNPANNYSCFQCFQEFQSQIVLEFIWYCSNSCKYKFAFKIVISVFPKATKEKQFILTKKIMEVSLR